MRTHLRSVEQTRDHIPAPRLLAGLLILENMKFHQTYHPTTFAQQALGHEATHSRWRSQAHIVKGVIFDDMKSHRSTKFQVSRSPSHLLFFSRCYNFRSTTMSFKANVCDQKFKLNSLMRKLKHPLIPQIIELAFVLT